MGGKQQEDHHGPAPKQGRGPDGRFTGGKPHNARRPASFMTLEALVTSIAKEPRQVTSNGQVRTMTQAERLLRLRVQAAAKGDRSALRQIIRLMIKYPQVVGDKIVINMFINGVALDV